MLALEWRTLRTMMMTATSSAPTAAWTWADQISSWRFWALMAGYLIAVPLADALLFQMLPMLTKAAGLTMVEVSQVYGVRHVATAFGFCLAWPALRWKPVPALLLLALVKAGGVVLIGDLAEGSSIGRILGAALAGSSTGAIVLLVPALVAGGRHGAEAFLVSFGTVSTVAVLFGVLANQAIGIYFVAVGAEGLAGMLLATIAAGAVLFATVGSTPFTQPPPVRERRLAPVRRRPVVTALLLFVPFYGLYWLYRIHGEVTTLAPSRKLLSPRGAAIGAVLVPFLVLVALASLMDALNEEQSRGGQARLRSPVTVYLWALFFMPVAVALVQSSVNRVSEAGQSAR